MGKEKKDNKWIPDVCVYKYKIEIYGGLLFFNTCWCFATNFMNSFIRFLYWKEKKENIEWIFNYNVSKRGKPFSIHSCVSPAIRTQQTHTHFARLCTIHLLIDGVCVEALASANNRQALSIQHSLSLYVHDPGTHHRSRSASARSDTHTHRENFHANLFS